MVIMMTTMILIMIMTIMPMMMMAMTMILQHLSPQTTAPGIPEPRIWLWQRSTDPGPCYFLFYKKFDANLAICKWANKHNTNTPQTSAERGNKLKKSRKNISLLSINGCMNRWRMFSVVVVAFISLVCRLLQLPPEEQSRSTEEWEYVHIIVVE